MRKPLTVVVIGCGDIAQTVHLNILARLSSVEAVAIAEPELRRLNKANCRSLASTRSGNYEGQPALSS